MHPTIAETRLKALQYMKPTAGAFILGNFRFNIADVRGTEINQYGEKQHLGVYGMTINGKEWLGSVYGAVEELKELERNLWIGVKNYHSALQLWQEQVNTLIAEMSA